MVVPNRSVYCKVMILLWNFCFRLSLGFLLESYRYPFLAIVRYAGEKNDDTMFNIKSKYITSSNGRLGIMC